MAPGGKNCDNIRLNDLLYFVDYKRKINAVNDVVSVCEAFYSSDAILEAKMLFYDVVGDGVDGIRFISRRGENPAKSNLEDLVNAMNKCDNDGVALPTFCSSDFTKIPQNNDGAIALNQIMFMMVEMKSQIAQLEKKCASSFSAGATPVTSVVASADAPVSASAILSTNVSFATSANVKAAAPSTAAPTVDPIAPAAPSATAAFPENPLNFVAALSESPGQASSGVTNNSTITANDLSSALTKVLPAAKKDDSWRTAGKGRYPPPEGGSKRNPRQPKSAEEQVKTNFKRNRNTVIGKKPSSGAMSWGGANLTVETYIGRVDFDVTSDLIKTDLVGRGVDVISIEENDTRHGLFKSFKMVIKKTDFDDLNSPELWPEGVVFRRFRRPRPPVDPGHGD